MYRVAWCVFSRGSCTTTNPTGTTAHLFHRSKWVKNRALDLFWGAEKILIPSGLQSFILAVRGTRWNPFVPTKQNLSIARNGEKGIWQVPVAKFSELTFV